MLVYYTGRLQDFDQYTFIFTSAGSHSAIEVCDLLLNSIHQRQKKKSRRKVHQYVRVCVVTQTAALKNCSHNNIKTIERIDCNNINHLEQRVVTDTIITL